MKVIHKHSAYAQGTVTMNAVEKPAMMLTIPHYQQDWNNFEQSPRTYVEQRIKNKLKSYTKSQQCLSNALYKAAVL